MITDYTTFAIVLSGHEELLDGLSLSYPQDKPSMGTMTACHHKKFAPIARSRVGNERRTLIADDSG